MKLELDRLAMSQLLILAGEGLRERESVLYRLRACELPLPFGRSVLMALNAIHALESAMGAFSSSGESAELGAALLVLANSFAKIEECGWDILKIHCEATRYEPHLVWIDDRYRLRFYNPQSGQYDVLKDHGWRLCGLPPKKRSPNTGG